MAIDTLSMQNTNASPEKQMPMKKSIGELKEAASKLVFGSAVVPADTHAGDAENGVAENNTSPAETSTTNGHTQNGHISPPAGYSQTGEFLGVAPAKVNGDPSNPGLPPPELAKTIACKFFPNCKYGDDCAFAHNVGMPMINGHHASTLPNGKYTPDRQSNPDAHLAQGGMPVPIEYAQYMAYMSPYGKMMPHQPQQYHHPMQHPYFNAYAARQPQAVPYGMAPPYGYLSTIPHQYSRSAEGLNGAEPSFGTVASPQPPTAASVNGISSPPTSPELSASNPTAQSQPSPVPQQQFSPNFSSPHQFSTPSHGNTAFQQQQQQQQHQQTDAVMAASGLRASNNAVPTSVNGHASHRRSNSLGPVSLHVQSKRQGSNNASLNANGASPAFNYPASTQIQFHPRHSTSSNPSHQQAELRGKRSAVVCNFFTTRQCLNGDYCHFSHPMPDGSDAKSLRLNIISHTGQQGDPNEIEAFRLSKEATGSFGRKSQSRTRGDISGPAGYRPSPFENGNQAINQHHQQHQSRPGRHSHSHHQKGGQRVPNGADFPALAAATPSSTSSSDANGVIAHTEDQESQDALASQPQAQERSGATSPLSATENTSAPSRANNAQRASQSAAISFASAAARGASAPAPQVAASIRKAPAAINNRDRSHEFNRPASAMLSHDQLAEPRGDVASRRGPVAV